MAVPKRDGLQPDYMTPMEKLSPLVVFFFPDWVGSESVWFFSFPIPSGLKFYFYELSKKVQESCCSTEGVSGHRAHSSDHSLNKAPLPWTGPPLPQVVMTRLTHGFGPPLGLFPSFSFRGKMSLSDFARSFWAHIKHATYDAAMDRGAWWAIQSTGSPKELDTTERLNNSMLSARCRDSGDSR